MIAKDAIASEQEQVVSRPEMNHDEENHRIIEAIGALETRKAPPDGWEERVLAEVERRRSGWLARLWRFLRRRR